jgi:mannose-6-phosphate isomerase-like protein (cupin superfamily)
MPHSALLKPELSNVLPPGFKFFLPPDFAVGEVLLSAATNSYFYEHRKIRAGETAALPDWPRVIIFIPQGSDVTLQVGDITLNTGDTLQLTNSNAEIKCISGAGSVLLTGGALAPNQADKILTRAGEHYKVTKPWGHELWLNGEDPVFNFKEVFIRAGHQTSLQYHHFKEETNLLFVGTADLIYKTNTAISNDNVMPADTGVLPLTAPSCVHMIPEVLHRLRATTDLYLYEVATPFLDDVIRVQDDANRAHGRVAAEHNAA